MGTLFYFLYILVVIGLYLTATPFGILNISYGEFICKSNEEDLADNCREITIMLDTDTPNTHTDGLLSKPVRMMSEFLNEFGIEVVKAVITLFVVIDPIGIVPLFASYTERMQTKDRKSLSKMATITAVQSLIPWPVVILNRFGCLIPSNVMKISVLSYIMKKN